MLESQTSPWPTHDPAKHTAPEGFQWIDANDAAARAHRYGRHLEPAARPAAEIDHTLAGAQQPL